MSAIRDAFFVLSKLLPDLRPYFQCRTHDVTIMLRDVPFADGSGEVTSGMKGENHSIYVRSSEPLMMYGDLLNITSPVVTKNVGQCIPT